MKKTVSKGINDIVKKAKSRINEVIKTMDLDEDERYWLIRDFPLEPQEVLSMSFEELKNFIVFQTM